MKIEKSTTACQQYADAAPFGSEIIGVVTDDDGMRGALARIKRSDGFYRYKLVNNGLLRPLDGRKVAAALGHAGRKSLGEAMQPVQINLSASDIAFCRALGDGNLSAGVRKAVGISAFLKPESI